MDDQVFAKRATIADREDEYRKQKYSHLLISPSRPDVFTEETDANPFSDAMKSNQYKQEKQAVEQQLKTKAKDGTLKEQPVKKRRRWDQAGDGTMETPTNNQQQLDSARSRGTIGGETVTPRTRNQWDETPGRPKDPSATPGQISARQWQETPAHLSDSMTPGRGAVATPSVRYNRFDETPHTVDRIGNETPGFGAGWSETPRGGAGGTGGALGGNRTPGISVRDDLSTVHDTPGTSNSSSKKRSRWDETPLQGSGNIGGTPGGATGTPGGAFTPSMMTPSMSISFTPITGGTGIGGGITPAGDKARLMATPGYVPCTPEQLQAFKWQREIDERNRNFTDLELEELLPTGYRIVAPPPGYVPLRTAGQRLIGTPTPIGTPIGFKMVTPDARNRLGGGSGGSGLNNAMMGDLQPSGDLPLMRPDDIQYFDKLLEDVDEDSLSSAELKEREIMKLLLKIKNGTPPIRKSAMRQITSKAKDFGPGPLLNQILPLLMSPTLEDQERHLLVKVIDRILYKLEDKVRPYVHKILVVIEPLLIDEDYYARQEGREIISNLAKAAGLASMISTLRPDIDNMDEYVRNTTARAFAVVAHALGIPYLLPFLKAVCKSKKSWQARHTGIKIVQQIAILMGCAILPHLRSLVEIIEHGLVDEQQKVRTITALALSALAEAATPYGIESFDSVLKPLWKGIRQHRGKGLAAFLKAIGYLIPLMDKDYASYYTKEVMIIVIREFQSPDEEMKKIVLKVVKQCCGTEGVTADYIKSDILPPFFRHFWNQRMAMDRRNSSQLIETTVEIANKVGVVVIMNRIVDDLKDESEPYRKMVIETIEKILVAQGADTIDIRLEEQLIDGILYAFQEQNTDQDSVMLNGFGSIVNALGAKAKQYIPQICATALFRLQNKSAKVRQQAADIIARIIAVMKTCQEEQFICYIGQHMYEFLGEEYPEVLGSILGALKAIIGCIGVERMTPPINELLPRLTPILKNRHEKVQENCIELVGLIADRGHDSVSGREWMRICFELLELLKAHKKSIRRATVNTFGYIAKAVGPHDVLATLLNNLKVQERQNRVCTTVAIAIVAETCSPFTVLPGLMNEFRVPDLNVQNGVLKSLSFMFEYIGEMAKDYIYAVAPLLEDALIDRDLVHRQTAISAVGHMALGVYGYGCEDALVHLLNCVWPNVLETSPHIVQAFVQCVESMRVSCGSITVLPYVLQGLWHPARKIRDMMWKIYNALYIGNQDGLVAGYPRIKNDNRNQYLRYELQYKL